MGSSYPIALCPTPMKRPGSRRAIAAATAALLVAGCTAAPEDAGDANAHLSRIYLAAVTNLQHVEANGADQAVMDRLDGLKQELSTINVGNDPCLARKQDQVVQTVKVVRLVTAAYAMRRNSTTTQRVDDFARSLIIRISDPENQPRATDSCYGKGLPEVDMGNQSI